jgi:hypothetical protein
VPPSPLSGSSLCFQQGPCEIEGGDERARDPASFLPEEEEPAPPSSVPSPPPSVVVRILLTKSPAKRWPAPKLDNAPEREGWCKRRPLFIRLAPLSSGAWLLVFLNADHNTPPSPGFYPPCQKSEKLGDRAPHRMDRTCDIVASWEGRESEQRGRCGREACRSSTDLDLFGAPPGSCPAPRGQVVHRDSLSVLFLHVVQVEHAGSREGFVAAAGGLLLGCGGLSRGALLPQVGQILPARGACGLRRIAGILRGVDLNRPPAGGGVRGGDGGEQPGHGGSHGPRGGRGGRGGDCGGVLRHQVRPMTLDRGRSLCCTCLQ